MNEFESFIMIWLIINVHILPQLESIQSIKRITALFINKKII